MSDTMVEHEINKLDNFICGYYMQDVSLCDSIIEWSCVLYTLIIYSYV